MFALLLAISYHTAGPEPYKQAPFKLFKATQLTAVSCWEETINTIRLRL